MGKNFGPLDELLSMSRGKGRSSYTGLSAPQLTIRMEPWVHGAFEELLHRSHASKNRLLNQCLEVCIQAMVSAMPDEEAEAFLDAATRRAAALAPQRSGVELEFDGQEGKSC